MREGGGVSSESLLPPPDGGRLDDVTELSEFRRGLIDGRRVVLLKIDLTGCCCCPSCSRLLVAHSAERAAGRPSPAGVMIPPTLGRMYCRSLSMGRVSESFMR
jgi:hypothetical protein